MYFKKFTLLLSFLMINAVIIFAQPEATLSFPDLIAEPGSIELPMTVEAINGNILMGNWFLQFDAGHLTFLELSYTNPNFPADEWVAGVSGDTLEIHWLPNDYLEESVAPGESLVTIRFEWDGVCSDFSWISSLTSMNGLGYSYNLTLIDGSVCGNSSQGLIEDFETGDFTKFDWQFNGDADWQMETINTYEGSFSAKSGDISDNQTSELGLMLDVFEPGPISFFVKVSSEGMFDKLKFFIDNNEMGDWSGEQDWQQVSFSVPVGTHFFRWIYEKDYAVSVGEDCAWIDYIVFPGGNISLVQADFIADYTSIEEGDTVHFTDVSTGSIQSWNWSFPGGEPSTSTEQNPVVIYNGSGSFDVTLTVSDGIDSSTKAKENYINVSCSLCGDILVIDLTEDHTSAAAINESLADNGIISTTMFAVPNTFAEFQAVFVSLGMYGNNHVLTQPEGELLKNYLTSGGKLYMEGGDTWYWDNIQGNWTPVHPMFNIIPLGQNYSNVITTIYGQDGSLAQGLTYDFSPNSDFHDYIDAQYPAIPVLKSDDNSNPGLFTRCVSFETDNYKTIGSSIEFDELADGENTKAEYMAAILEFFEVGNNQGDYSEDFETGDFSKFDWQFSGDADWVIDGNTPMGNYAAKSGLITDSQSTELFLTMNVAEPGNISFFRKVSSENNYDKLSFFINDQEMGNWSGEEDWAEEVFPVNMTGDITFRWVYSKDYAVSNGDDCAWIDNIVFPGSQPPCPPVVASFTATMGNASMLFQSTSQGDIAQWEWDFGDGTYASGENVTHYFEPGTYNVCLTVYSACDTTMDTYCEEITVEGCPPCVSYFDWEQDPNDVYTVYFSNVPVDSIASWYWDFGDGNTSNEQLPTHTYSEEGTYEICLTVTSSCSYCADTYCTDVSIIDPGLYNLGGTVFADQVPIDEGFAYLYKMDGNQIVDVFAAFISEYGYYDFYQLEEGYYILKAELSPNSPLYNQYIPTYYGDVPNWVNASVIHLQANTWNADVNMIPISNAPYGSGLISGTIIKENNEKGDFGPAPDIEVLLLDENNSVLEYAFTDINGIFSFDELAFGTYKIMVEVMGKYSIPAVVTLDNSTSSVEDLNFVITGDNITLSVDEHLPGYLSGISNVYPNPVVNQAKISFNLTKPVTIDVTLVNIVGQNVYTYSENAIQGFNTININTEKLENGMYYVYLNFDNSYQFVRKFIKTK